VGGLVSAVGSGRPSGAPEAEDFERLATAAYLIGRGHAAFTQAAEIPRRFRDRDLASLACAGRMDFFTFEQKLTADERLRQTMAD
jgi:hypothetical protein